MRAKFWHFIAVVTSTLILLGNVAMADMAPDEDLITLAKKRFEANKSEEESKAFEKFFRKVQDGETADFTPELKTGTDPRDLNILTDPAYGDRWQKERVIRAEWLAWLCFDPKACGKVTPHGVAIAGAKIEGKL